MNTAIRELHEPAHSNVPTMLCNLAAVAAAIVSLCTGWPTSHPLWVAGMIVWLAYFQHCWTIIFHEDAHFSLYPKARWHNVFNGTIIGTLLMIPFSVFRQVHIRHHNKMNTPDDEELWPYVTPTCSLAFRRAFLVFDVLLGLWAAPFIYNRVFFIRNSPIRDPKLRRRIWFEFAGIAAFWTTLVGLVAYYGVWYQFALAYLIPAWLTGMIQTVRKLTEHLGLPAGDAMTGARTVMSSGLLGRFVAETSFHIEAHGLHHKYPQMPHMNLERAMEVTQNSAPELVFPNYWRAIRDMIPHLRHPGIGVNAQPRTATAHGPSVHTANP